MGSDTVFAREAGGHQIELLQQAGTPREESHSPILRRPFSSSVLVYELCYFSFASFNLVDVTQGNGTKQLLGIEIVALVQAEADNLRQRFRAMVSKNCAVIIETVLHALFQILFCH